MLTSEAGKTVHVELDAGEQMICPESTVNESLTDPAVDNDQSTDGLY